jgi:hypothetical protein
MQARWPYCRRQQQSLRIAQRWSFSPTTGAQRTTFSISLQRSVASSNVRKPRRHRVRR